MELAALRHSQESGAALDEPVPAPRTLSGHTRDVNEASTGIDLGSPFEKAAEWMSVCEI